MVAAAPVSNDALLIYAQELADIPADQLAEGIKYHLRTATDRFFPTIRAIREACDAAAGNTRETWEAAWDRMVDFSKLFNPFDHDGCFQLRKQLTPRETKALETFFGGWDAIRLAEELTTLRAQFRDWWKGHAEIDAKAKAIERRPDAPALPYVPKVIE